jgi:hypothetical protein
MRAEKLPGSRIGKNLIRKEADVPEDLVLHSGIGGREDPKQVMPGRFVQRLEEACIIFVGPVQKNRQRLPT